LIYIYKLSIDKNQAQDLGAGLHPVQSGKHYPGSPGPGKWNKNNCFVQEKNHAADHAQKPGNGSAPNSILPAWLKDNRGSPEAGVEGVPNARRRTKNDH
jgi:hypothetical protein